MNNAQSLSRILLYARKHYVENSRQYLFGLLALIALPVLIFYITSDASSRIFIQLIMPFSWIYFTQITCRSHYARRSSERSYMLPVSSGEKYLFIWFNSVIAAPVVTTATVLLVSALFSWSSGSTYGLEISDIDSNMLLVYYLFQAGALLCCCWVKGSPLKGYLTIVGILFGIILVYDMIDRMLPVRDYQITPTNGSCHIYSDSARISYQLLPLDTIHNILPTILACCILIGWAAAYFKFKERTLK